MGGKLGKRPDDSSSGSSGQILTEYSAELSSYEAACRLDPELQTFDAALRQRTSRVFFTLDGGSDLHSLSLDSLMAVTGCFLETNDEVVRHILESKKDVWNSRELFQLVEAYLETSLQTLEFCTVLEKCLKRARTGQLRLQLALQAFNQDKAEVQQQNGQKKYTRTLEELGQFKAAANPFCEEFFQVFDKVHQQQRLMLCKLRQQKNKLDKKLKSVKAWKKVSNVIFGATFAVVLICSVVAAAVSAPPVVPAVTAAASASLGAVGKWINGVFKGYKDAIREEKGVLGLMELGINIAIKDLENIRALAQQLEVQITSLVDNAEFALRYEEAAEFGIEEIKKKLEVFTKSNEDLGKMAHMCSSNIHRARMDVLRRIENKKI